MFLLYFEIPIRRNTSEPETAQTFWATWLTQWEVQLLRSGPFGCQVPLERTHKYDAVPERKKTKKKTRTEQEQSS